MLKRFFLLSLLLISGVLFTGCTKVQDLSEDETKLIAEYAAGVLLKYDTHYRDRIDEGDKALEQQSSQEPSSEVEENTQQEVTTQADTANEQSAPKETDGRTEETASMGTENDIAKIAGIEGVSITYRDYQIADEYPAAEGESEAVALETQDGYQLLILRFKVVSTSESPIDVSLLDKSIGYQLICNGSLTAEPMLTILTEDLGTLDITVEPNEEQEAVLVFQVSDTMKDQLGTMDLIANYNQKNNMITILK